MSQEIICSRKNAETQDPRAFIARIIIVQSCGVSGGFYASDPGQTDPVAIFRNDLFDSVYCFTVNDFDLSRGCRQDDGSHESFRLSKYDNLKICNSVVGALWIQMIVPHHLLKESGLLRQTRDIRRTAVTTHQADQVQHEIALNSSAFRFSLDPAFCLALGPTLKSAFSPSDGFSLNSSFFPAFLPALLQKLFKQHIVSLHPAAVLDFGYLPA